jgi:hypothetical protein
VGRVKGLAVDEGALDRVDAYRCSAAGWRGLVLRPQCNDAAAAAPATAVSNRGWLMFSGAANDSEIPISENAPYHGTPSAPEFWLNAD